MNPIDNLYQYVDFKGLSINQFSLNIGVSNSYFSKTKKSKGSIGSKIIEKIVKKYEDLNIDWLMTGRGEMLRNSKNVNVQHSQNTAVNGVVSVAPPDIEPKLEALKKEIAEKNTEIAFLRKTIENMQEQITFLQTQIKK